jgi:hypothetical protein
MLKLYYYDISYLPYGTYHRNWTVTVKCQGNTKLRDLRYDTRFPYEMLADLKTLASSRRAITYKDVFGKDYNVRVEEFSTQGLPPDLKTGECLVSLLLNEL